jgi:hypothetical protein
MDLVLLDWPRGPMVLVLRERPIARAYGSDIARAAHNLMTWFWSGRAACNLRTYGSGSAAASIPREEETSS